MRLVKLKLVVLASLTCVLQIVGAHQALGSCVMPPPMGKAVREAEIVFIGTVTETTNSERWATVAVEEIWKGDDIDPIVEVKAGPADPPGEMMAGTSVDRTFKDGERYLFFPYRTRSGTLKDSSCSNTTRWTADLERFRPPAVRELSPPYGGDDTVEDDSVLTYVFAGAGAGLVVALIIVFARGRMTD